jgi:hypothetical protein
MILDISNFVYGFKIENEYRASTIVENRFKKMKIFTGRGRSKASKNSRNSNPGSNASIVATDGTKQPKKSRVTSETPPNLNMDQVLKTEETPIIGHNDSILKSKTHNIGLHTEKEPLTA